MNSYEKWNRYTLDTLGKIAWINRTREYPHRSDFVDRVMGMPDAVSILEVGPGELIEYQRIKDKQKQVKYAVVDVSDSFLANCELRFSEIDRYQCSMEEWRQDIPEFDLIYVASVIEHTNDVAKCISNLVNAAKEFYFVMFKWIYSGGLKPRYMSKKGYWSTCFNIWNILSEIQKYGTISSNELFLKTGERIPFEQYSLDKTGEHRTGDYLVIRGERNGIRKTCKENSDG